MNIIGDIAGNYKTLRALLKKMPKGEFVSLGDMIDRGPRSKEVLDFIMANGQAVLGNHEHLLIDRIDSENKIYNGHKQTTPYYPSHVWFNNGGLTTMESFCPGFDSLYMKNSTIKISSLVDPKYVLWLKTLPFYLTGADYFLSHAPKNPQIKLEESNDLGGGFFFQRFVPEFKTEASLLWHRGDPAPMDGKIQVYGHNSYPAVLFHTINQPQGVIQSQLDNSKIFAIGIDTSANRVLTGLHLPSMTIYQQDYID